MRKLIIISSLLMVSLVSFGQLNLKYIRTDTSFTMIEKSSGDTLFMFSEVLGISFPNNTYLKSGVASYPDTGKWAQVYDGDLDTNDFQYLQEFTLEEFDPDSAEYADTAGYTLKADSAEYADTAGYALKADSAEYADTAGYALAGVGGVTPNDDILDWDATGTYYTPYTSETDGVIYSGATDPDFDNSSRANFAGGWGASKLYTSFVNITEAGEDGDGLYYKTETGPRLEFTASGTEVYNYLRLPGLASPFYLYYNSSSNDAEINFELNTAGDDRIILNTRQTEVQCYNNEFHFIKTSSPTDTIFIITHDSSTFRNLVYFDDFIKLNPLGSAPSGASLGAVYVNTDNHIYFYNGTSWVQMDN